ncbi:transcriptional regulator, DeoR family [Tistlia consotensis]|uniref:Transcriptional regulator, DeoR family n=1 Tax=Tistlia consotensis USBA 355 TaxID=560819 RepID=A0A1Y6BYD3_9PROT|nr:DeoR/GlpR family DNA-binding transcription regulator [Tistlia consotensis]SMF36038.1 transcriptional regulator, DeoR family [Tistlia consotensis USBA 355]SNR71283.1 transcriptional regulator, DeoR family [Tistlia consotensis]
MHRTARQNAILEALDGSGSATVAELTRTLGVSDETIRRDIKAMAGKGLVERVHGGVILPDIRREPAFQKRMSQNAAAKQAIARRVAALVENGDSLMLDTGSTTAYVARALADHRDLFVVTNSVEIARTLANGKKGNRVYLAGGELRGDDGATFGPNALEFVKRFRARFAIISVGALHPDEGVMDFHLQEAEFCQTVIACAARVVAVADVSKFRNQAPVKVCDIGRLDLLVTDRPPPEAFAERLREQEVELLIAG